MNKDEYKRCLKNEIGNTMKKSLRGIFNNSIKAIYWIRKSQYLYKKGKIRTLLSKYYTYKLGKTYGIFINPQVQIGEGLKLPHPTGIIIGEAVSIGKNCTIYQQVTIGSSHVGDVKLGKQPKIMDNCVIFSGAKVIGDIIVNDSCIIGANSLLNKDTDNNCVYVGTPARKIRSNNYSVK